MSERESLPEAAVYSPSDLRVIRIQDAFLALPATRRPEEAIHIPALLVVRKKGRVYYVIPTADEYPTRKSLGKDKASFPATQQKVLVLIILNDSHGSPLFDRDCGDMAYYFWHHDMNQRMSFAMFLHPYKYLVYDVQYCNSCSRSNSMKECKIIIRRARSP